MADLNIIKKTFSITPANLKRLDNFAKDLGRTRSATIAMMIEGLDSLSNDKALTKLIEQIVESNLKKVIKAKK